MTRRASRTALVVAGAAAAVVLAGAVFINSGLVPQTVMAPTVPSPFSLVQKTAVFCRSTDLMLAGPFTGCATVVEGMSCPAGSFDTPRVMHLRGATGVFILYLEVDGGYHGPGTYALSPWPTSSLNAGDRIAKVAVREWNSGRLWQSLAGSLVIDSSEKAGSVDARLESSADIGAGLIPGPILRISGPWQCT